MQDRTSKMRPFRKLLMTGVAVLFLTTGTAHAAEKVDWGKYCGPNNERCDPSDSEDKPASEFAIGR
jgi:hypothetical protein